MEFTREDWDFILHQDDPDFAQKFDALIRKYACRAYEDASNFPDRRAVGYIYYWTSFDNWLCKMRMRDLDAFIVFPVPDKMMKTEHCNNYRNQSS